MEVSIVHSGVRVHPDLVIEVSALIDGRPIRVDLERGAIERLLGSDVSDEEALRAALTHKLETIRMAIEAYVFARGAPLDGYLVLSWRDFSGVSVSTLPASAS